MAATASKVRKPLRLWPGVVIVTLQLLLRFVVPAFIPDALLIGVMGTLAGAALIFLWWLFFSRAAWVERLGALALTAVSLLLTRRLIDISLSTGAQGFLFPFMALPGISLGLVLWAILTRRLPDGIRRATMVATILFTCGFWLAVRTGGFTAATFHSDLHWRWTMTPEEKLLSKSGSEPGALPIVPASPAQPVQPVNQPAAAPAVAAPAIAAKTEPAVAAAVETPQGPDWPGFRGPHRDDIVTGVRIKTDWKASPPAAMWKRPVGPGWSSFAVRDGLFYTQEQRGPDEVVTCYKVSTGQPVWAHRDAARFWESNGGPGPRGTPTLDRGRVYTFGATGLVNVLRAADGSVVWSHNAASEIGMKTPQWGFASSPLVAGDQVIVAVAGQLVAYDRATGAQRWTGPAHGVSYSSPQLANIDGVDQVLLLSEAGITSVALADGKLLWEHPWPGYPIVQPALTSDGNVLAAVTNESGIRRLAVSLGAGGWTVAEQWTSKGLKPYFNDFVVHDGHAFGFDGSILSCIDLKDGKRVWKGGRYGAGQLILVADANVLLVLTEEGELALVRAAPDQFTELARVPGIEGKTWGHPVVAGDVLLVRNGEEMAAFKLALATN